MLDRAGVMPGCEPTRTGATRESEELGEAKAPVAADTRVRRLYACVAADERLDDRATELRPEVERDMGYAEPVTRLACGDHRFGRAACAFGVRARGVEPEPQRDTDGLRQIPQEGHRAVDAAAHRDRDA